MKRLVLLGGGHSHLEVMRRFGERPAAETEIVLVDPARFATYSGMLPGLIAGHYGFPDCHINLEQLCRGSGVRFIKLRAVEIHPQNRVVALEDGSHLSFDILSIDVGSTPPTAAVNGAAEHALAVKPFDAFALHWEQLIAAVQNGHARNIVVIGGGAAGVELAFAMQYRLAKLRVPAMQFELITAAPCLLPDHNPRTRNALERLLAARKIVVHANAAVACVEAKSVKLADGGAMESDATVWATGAGAPSWLARAGLMLDKRGFIRVNEHLQSVSDAAVFSAGDCAAMEGHDIPKSGVYAVREGPVLAENLRHALFGEPLDVYRPQPTALALISAGSRYAVASYGGAKLEGAWVWYWKDYIDRKFVRRYQN